MTEDLGIYLADHGRECIAGGHEFLGLRDQTDSEVSVGRLATVSAGYALTVQTSDVALAGLKNGTAITVDGVRYTVRDALQLDDGAFTQVNVSKS